MNEYQHHDCDRHECPHAVRPAHERARARHRERVAVKILRAGRPRLRKGRHPKTITEWTTLKSFAGTTVVKVARR